MSLHNVTIGKKAPDLINVVIEIQKGSNNKYEYDEETGVIKLDRVLYSAVHFPTDYGFIPDTRSEDGDHLDALVIGEGEPVGIGCVVRVRPVGLLRMIDSGDEDFKIIGVQEDNPRLAGINNLSDLKAKNSHLIDEIAEFFKTYKNLQKKEVQILGWDDMDAAKKEITRAQEAYAKEDK